MATNQKKPVTKKAEKEGLDIEGALTRKYGPLPAWGWLGIGGGGLYLYRKLHPGTSTGASSTTTADDGSGFGGSFTPLGDGGGSGSGGSSDPGIPTADVSGGGTGPDTTTPTLGVVPDTNNTGGLGSTPANTGPGAARSAPVPTPAQVRQVQTDLPGLSRSEFTDASASKAYSNPTLPVPATTSNFALASAAKTAGAAAAGVPVAFGGVTDVKTNKQTGVTTTTYANGRIVQQAPGKSAYVAKKGS